MACFAKNRRLLMMLAMNATGWSRGGWLSLWRAGLDVIFPRDCVVTGEPVENVPWRYVSQEGLSQLRRFRPFLCDTYGLPVCADETGVRTYTPTGEIGPVFRQGRTAMIAQGPVRRMVHVLKYGQGVHLVEDMARLMVDTPGMKEFLADATVVPVPLFRTRLRERGYNQATLLVEELARQVSGMRVAELLVRRRDTGTQTKLNREAREKNMRRAFVVRPGVKPELARRHVVLDDVFTTGATLNACAAALVDAGVEWVDVVSFAHG